MDNIYQPLNLVEIEKEANAFIKDCEKELDLIERFEKLQKTFAFHTVIEGDYLKGEPVRIAELKAQIRTNPDEFFKLKDEVLNERLNAVAMFGAWIDNMSIRKQQALTEIEQTKLGVQRAVEEKGLENQEFGRATK